MTAKRTLKALADVREALRSMRAYLPYGSVRHASAYEKVEAALQDATRWSTLLLILESDESEPILNKLFESDAKEWTAIVDNAIRALQSPARVAEGEELSRHLESEHHAI